MLRNKQFRFTLLKFMVAAIAIATTATLGVKGYKYYCAIVNYTEARDTLKCVSEGLDVYCLNYGSYPILANYESMINADSPLVQEDLIPVGLPIRDPWGHSYECASDGRAYKLKCIGDSGHKTGEEILIESSRLSENVLASQYSGISDDER